MPQVCLLVPIISVRLCAGITGGTLAGMIISDQILGRENRFSDVSTLSGHTQILM